MKIMLDTNILISAFVFKSKKMNTLIEILSKYHTILISEYTIEELKELIKSKFNVEEKYLARFLNTFPFKLINSPKKINENLFGIRDKDDYLILYTAILGNADIFITGDKDFENVKINKPKIMSASEFIEKYGN